MLVETVVVGALQTNCYVLGCERTRQAIVIDPGDDTSVILGVMRRHHLSLERLAVTHAHFDHLLAARPLQEATGAPLYVCSADRPLLKSMRRTAMSWLGYDPGEPPDVAGDLVPGTPVLIGDQTLEIRSTPGHSPGGVTFVDHDGRRAFTGDTIFAVSIGRTDFPEGDMGVLLEAIRREILSLPDEYSLLPGHGPSSTVQRERTTNPFLTTSRPLSGW
jgi:hydroxyacylglutathione hydrolase